MFNNINTENNELLIQHLREGNEATFEFVYKLYYPKLCGFCYQYIKRQEDIEEIVQGTMLWLWESRSDLIPEYSLKSLLFTIVKNRALNHITHTNIKNRVHTKLMDTDILENYDTYFDDELFKLYNKALKQLPENIKDTFTISRSGKLTHKEIAEKLNVSPQTVNYRIGQALKHLRVALKDYLDR